MLRFIVRALAASLLMAAASPPVAEPRRDFRPLAGGSLVADKNFYLLTALAGLPAARAAIARDPLLAGEAARERALIADARKACAGDPVCLLQPFLWRPEDAGRLGDALVAALERAGALHPLCADQLRPSGRFQLYAGLDDAALVHAAWRDAAAGMNHIVRVWGMGEKPLYPLIDSRSYPDDDKLWRDSVAGIADLALDEPPPAAEPFFALRLGAALDLLDFNDRDEPARLEPLDRGENAAALAYARTIDWPRWRYAALVIPGRSPSLRDNPLSPEAKLKLRLAARRFAGRIAPLIITTGGYVAPSQTRFAEALEMKRALIARYGIPERAILVDPYARHTTTNLRNAGRLLFEAGAPPDPAVLITTTEYQSGYIEGAVFHDRNLRELGYLPFGRLVRLSPFDHSATLPLVTLQRDARDPLDP